MGNRGYLGRLVNQRGTGAPRITHYIFMFLASIIKALALSRYLLPTNTFLSEI